MFWYTTAYMICLAVSVIQKLNVGYEVRLFVSGTPLVCIRSQRRVLAFEVHTRRLYPSQVQVYPGKYERRYTRVLRYIVINVAL